MLRRSGSRRSRAAAIALLGALATACPSDAPTPLPSGSAPLFPTKSRGGGEIVMAYPDEPATLDPFLRAGEAPATRDLVRLVMPALERLAPDGSRTPWLLAGEPVVEDGPPFAVTITLRDDAVWSDGRPITTEDVRFTWRAALDPRRQVATRDGYDRISRIRILGPTRARLEFSQRFARWRDLFSAGLGVLPAHKLRARWPVSGGPFVLRRWRRGLDMVFERNPRAWGEGADIDRLRVVFVPDAIGALELLRRGDVDVVGPYQAPDWRRRAGELQGATLTEDTGATWAALLMNARAEPFDDRRVRAALADALDRERFIPPLAGVDEALQTATPGLSGGEPFARFGNLARAEDGLADAGWTGSPRRKGSEVLNPTLVYVGDDLTGTIARAVQFQAVRAGFDLQTVGLDVEDLWGSWLHGSRFEAAIVIWRDAPGGSMRARFGTSGAGAARVRTRPRLVDAALDRHLAAADRAAAPVYPRAADARLAAMVPVLPLFAVPVFMLAREGVGGVCASAEADGPLWNAHRWSLTEAVACLDEAA